MQFNKNSWHYRFLIWLDSYPIPDNLCPYVRKVLFNLIGICGVGIFLVLLIAFLIWFMVIGPFIDNSIGMAVVSSFLWLLIGITALKFVRTLYNEASIRPWWLAPLHDMSKKPRTNSLVTAYIVALHDKLCPTIEFVDEEKDRAI